MSPVKEEVFKHDRIVDDRLSSSLILILGMQMRLFI